MSGDRIIGRCAALGSGFATMAIVTNGFDQEVSGHRVAGGTVVALLVSYVANRAIDRTFR